MLTHHLKLLIRWRLFLYLTMTAPLAHAELAQMLHQPVNSANEGVPIQIMVTFSPPALRVYQARVYYRAPDQTTFRFRQMVPQADGWEATIPAVEIRGPRLQYFISASVENDLVLLYPEFNPYNRPADILVSPADSMTNGLDNKRHPVSEGSTKIAAQSATFPEIVLKQTFQDTIKKQPVIPITAQTEEKSLESPILILSPEENETVSHTDISLAISLVSGNVEVDSSTVKIWLDGADVTSLTSLSPSLVTYEPRHLKPGKHTVQVDAKTIDGNSLPAAALHFKIAEEKATPPVTRNMQIHIFADGRSEEFMKNSNTFYIGGVDFSGQYGSLQYEGNLYVTSMEKRIEQPSNRYHLTLYNKWLGISAGDNHPMYNDLILWGKRVRGLSGYIHLGLINLDYVAGETNRPVEGSLSTLSGIVPRTWGTYKQNLIGIRPSFGSGKRFQLGLSLVKVKDAIDSITNGSMPKDNLVFGPDLKLSLDRGRFLVEARAAMSFLTENIAPGSITSNDIDNVFGANTDLPIDPTSLSRYLIINESTTPLDPLQKTSIAYNTSVKLDYFHNLLQVGYKSIGAAYMSLANAWLRKDVEGLYFTDRLRLFNNKFYATIGYEDFTDNFTQQNANPAVSLKTLYYAVTFYPGKGMPQLTLSMRDHHRDNGIQATSLLGTLMVDNRDRQVFRDLSAQCGYDVHLWDLQHTVNLSYVSTRNMDDYHNDRETETGVVLLAINTQFVMPLKTNISFASNRNRGPMGQGNLDYLMFGGGAEYGLWHNRLTVLVDGRRMRMANVNTSTSSLNRDQARMGATFQITPRHTVMLDANFIKMSSVVSGSIGSYMDKIIRLRYDRYF